MAIKALTSPVNVPPSAHTVVPAPALPDATEHAYRDAMTPPQALSTDAVRPRPPPIVTALSAPEDVQLSPSSRHSMSAPFIKPEPSATPQQSPPPTAHASADRRVSVPETALDADTLKAIETVKQSELGLRARKPDKSLSPLDAPLPTAVPKKRSAPRGGPANRKGGAAKRQANKKRKVDGDAQIPLPASRVSRTPTMGSRASKRSVAGTSSASSPAVESVPTCASDEGSDASDDKATYCICRKPDNHQFMIGCDGGCDDWFHGTCVKVASEDEDLIDKFICPNCHERGKGRTTWKRMCRRTGCRRPARTTQGRQSKFCSEDCGIGFFGTLARHVDTPRTARVKRAPSSKTTPEQGSDSDDEPGLLGGVLRIKNLKSLVLACDDVGLFRRLGSGQLSPPATASSTETNLDAARLNVAGVEKDRMVALAAEQREFEVRLELLRDRETFVSLVKEQVARHAEGEPKPKEFCGYDARLAWSEREFARWRQSKAGQLALQLHTLSPTAEQTAMANGTEHGTEHDDETDDVDLVAGQPGARGRRPGARRRQGGSVHAAAVQQAPTVAEAQPAGRALRAARGGGEPAAGARRRSARSASGPGGAARAASK